MQPELCDRLLNFGIHVILLLRKLPNNLEYRTIKFQLIKSATSSGANYEEAQGGSSRKDFKNKVLISLKEMRESNYWLRIIRGINENVELNTEIETMEKESAELKNILGSIASKLD